MLESLDEDPEGFLCELGQKLLSVYQAAHPDPLPQDKADETIQAVARHALEQRYTDIGYKRLFVQKLVAAFHHLRRRGVIPSLDEL